jgi:TolA-binding protein
MHILRWLMKHPILLAWLLAIVAILLNFGMGGKSDGLTTHEVAGGHAQEAAPAAAAGHEQGAAPAQAQQAAGATTGHEQVAAPAAPAQQAGIAEAASVVNNQQGATATADTSADLLRAAREAYWSNELDNAVDFYNKLIQQTPDLEYKGELANVYWKQGNVKQAATLFAEVAPQRAAQGRMTEALNMKLYVDMADPELAKQLDAALKK